MTACQLCTVPGAATVTLTLTGTADLCPSCAAAMTGPVSDAPHWSCLHDAVWSDDATVQGMAWRVPTRLAAPRANDPIDICDPSPEVRAWAAAELPADIIHRDCNGAVLMQGATVTLIKVLPVKGAGFAAKRGTAVRGNAPEPYNAGQIKGQIERRVEGQPIVILTEYLKKA